MKTSAYKKASGFTLIELMVAMAITTILVVIIVTLTTRGIEIWKNITQEISTSSKAQIALQTMCDDLQCLQIRRGNDYEWFYAANDEKVLGTDGGPQGLRITNSAQLIFFTSSIDRNKAVESEQKNTKADLYKAQGDINAVGYRLMYRDQILNIDGNAGKGFATYSLYRQIVSPKQTYQNLLAQTDLKRAYNRYEENDKKHFLVENIIEMTLVLEVEYTTVNGTGSKKQLRREIKSIPIISTSSGGEAYKSVEVFGDRLAVSKTGGKADSDMEQGRILAASITMTVVSDEGMNIVQNARKNGRTPNQADFFRKYTNSYSQSVMLPTPQ
ncbi:PulJ/GspJ family protein [Akkermansia glycaniphila]|uniref:Type iv pilin n-term methylation site gfxxxe n=1 Tax=Akkermansia glycaniphila TaxID=1679444 RepID=A0A1C7PBT0_9BACT|nr:prepilin-type N-terminal cleavage/methylation domain-containing protein [Akkermansia glycaniphila]OCA03026.1 hypothetical protein AC781_07300 [Akkermansia glycaniphila]SEH94764.1 type iv pilin n-term methylation site gfxxxe [Akkermansia glycaniphila]